MTTLVAIRTHRWDEDAQRLYAQLAPVMGENLVVVFHNRPEGLSLPLPVVDLSEDWVKAQGLATPSNWGWRCGDYSLYALRQARPDLTRAWLIEPDVWFAGDPAEFFQRSAASPADAMGDRVRRCGPEHRFGRGMRDIEPWRALFALVRFSAGAIDHLFEQRKAYANVRVHDHHHANDEVFSFSHCMAGGQMKVRSMARLCPEWISPQNLRTDPDILDETLINQQTQGVFHPVRSRAMFKKALAARIASNTGFMPQMRSSLARLTAEELDSVFTESMDVLRGAIMRVIAEAEPASSEAAE